MTFKSRRHRRRFHTERIIDKRQRRYKREATDWEWWGCYPDPGYIYPERGVNIYEAWQSPERQAYWEERKPGTSPKVRGGSHLTGWRLSKDDYWRSRCGKGCPACNGWDGRRRA